MTTIATTNEVRLDDPQQLTEVFDDLDLGSVDRDGLRSYLGRNANWRGTTTTGLDFFAKRLIGPEARRRFDGSRAAAGRLVPQVRTPALLASDERRSFLVFEVPPGARPLDPLFGDVDEVRDEIVACAATLAAVHEAAVDGLTRTPPVSSPAVVPLERYHLLTAGQLAALRIIHGDACVRSAASALLSAEGPAAGLRPVHGDVRLDQILTSDVGPHLIDFEEFGLGDPARDVGALLGGVVHAVVVSVPDHLELQDPNATDEEIVRVGSERLDLAASVIEEAWETYLAARGLGAADGSALAERVVAHAGWHMFDRLLASAEASAVLSPSLLAAAGIGRELLCAPAEHAASVGIGV